jgi:outer membrane protein TolC
MKGIKIMKRAEIIRRNAALFLLIVAAFSGCFAEGEETGSTGPPRHITLQEAVQLALQHNHDIRIAGYTVEEKQHAKEVAKSSYFPSIRNDSSFVHLTDTQLIEIRAGELGVAGGTSIPPVNSIINQGGLSLTTSGTQLTQPLTNLLKIKPANDMAQAELKGSRQKAQLTGTDVALQVHQVYYQILIAQAHRSATDARIKASQELQSERIQQVKLGSTLQQDLIDSRAQLLEAKQELLATDLQLSDLALKLNDLIGLPLTTALDLDPSVTQFSETCRREECVTAAAASHPGILEARAEVEKAGAAVRLAKVDIRVPDVEAFARYSYQNNVPFLARNFGSFGIHLGFDLFDAGRKRGVLHEREAQLSQAKENLAKLTDQVKLAVETAYNKLERTQQMLKVSEEALALRTESSRVLQQELAHGVALSSQADQAVAQEFDAKTLMLQSQLAYTEAHDELIHAIGQTPK